MGELVAQLHLPAPTLTRLVDGAVDSALAYRLPDPADGRKVVVHLSDVGRTRLARLEALVSAHEAALASALGHDRVAGLVRALVELAAGDSSLQG
jgi:DNA-binding MarR family transcriptional regulator